MLAAARKRAYLARVGFDGLFARDESGGEAVGSRTGSERRETVRRATALAPTAQPRPAPPGRALPAAGYLGEQFCAPIDRRE